MIVIVQLMKNFQTFEDDVVFVHFDKLFVQILSLYSYEAGFIRGHQIKFPLNFNTNQQFVVLSVNFRSSAVT